MLSNIKSMLKWTPIYPIYRGVTQLRNRQAIVQGMSRWSNTDDRRAEFYSALVRPGDLVFDVGANMGNRSKVFLKLGANVIAFEPQRRCAALLSRGFRGMSAFHLEPCALGASPGQQEMFVSDAHTISSMSTEWIDRVQSSGRFAGFRWNQRAAVPVETLDSMIAKWGKPSFVKIDVEGYEHMVIRGLSNPVRALSLEFIPEHRSSTMECAAHLDRLGAAEFRISLGESMRWDLGDWRPLNQLIELLSKVPERSGGDIYIRYPGLI